MSWSSVPVGPAVPSLTRWGLSSDADLAYRTLTCFGPQTRAALASELGLPRQRIDTALAELGSCGVATALNASRGDRRQGAVWVVRPPAEVVTALRVRRMRLADHVAQARRHHEVVRMLSARLAGLGLPAAPGTAGLIGEDVRHFSSRTLVRRRLGELMAQERHDHLAINTHQALEATTSRAIDPDDPAFADRGVQVRVLGVPPPDADAVDPDGHLVNDTSYQYRESFETPLKLFVCDRRVALFPVDPLDFDRGYFEVGQPAVVAALVGLFDRHWATATDPRRHGVPSIVLSDREHDLISLLAMGHTDVTAARQLRITARSVTNRMRALMDRLGVENRFQLGLVLGATRAAAPPSLDPAAPSGPALAELRRAS